MHRLLRECLIYSSLINKKQSLFVSVGSRGAGRNAVLLKNLKEATQYNRELKPQMKGKILCHSVSSKWTWCNRSTQNKNCIDSYAFIFASMTHLYEKSCEQILFFFTSTDSSSLDILVEIYYHGSEGIQQPTLPAKEDMQSLSQKQLDTMISLCHCSNNEWQPVTEKYAESRIIRVCTSHERWRE